MEKGQNAYSPRQLNSIAAREGGHDDPVLHSAPPLSCCSTSSESHVHISADLRGPGKIEIVIVAVAVAVEAGQFLDHMRHHHRVCRVQKHDHYTHRQRA